MGSEPAGQLILDIGPQERGRWTDFVARFVFSHEDDGITQVWRDGTLVVDRVGMPNHYNNARGPYIKFGFYKSGWLERESMVTTRTIYYDAIRVYEGSNGYSKVAPGSHATDSEIEITDSTAPSPSDSLATTNGLQNPPSGDTAQERASARLSRTTQ